MHISQNFDWVNVLLLIVTFFTEFQIFAGHALVVMPDTRKVFFATWANELFLADFYLRKNIIQQKQTNIMYIYHYNLSFWGIFICLFSIFHAIYVNSQH